MEFVNQTKRIFQELVNGGGPEFDSCSLNSRSLISSEYPNLVFDSHSLSDFRIPDEIFRTEDFNVSQWCSPLKNDLFSPPLGNPFDSDEKHESPTISCTDVDQIGNNGGLEAILAPIIRGSHSNFHSFSSESKPKPVQHVDGSTLGPKERLFSKLGIEELLEGISGISNAASTSCIEDQIGVKRIKTGNCMWEVNSLQKEMMPKLETSYCYSGSGSSVVECLISHLASRVVGLTL
ncbi:hypothetical protein L2E82_45097 [Cichorium intybus]|uniref:Uncharacterized protein n=1 Tax=Cichorium intybus TaxID=13427 RepID=A0ACB8ZSD2_CICIN|nr:hypothetical protein L2E82_45097 [Cichorium intybus]